MNTFNTKDLFYIIDILGSLTKEQVKVTIGKNSKIYLQPEKIVLSTKFFQSWICPPCEINNCCNKINTCLFYAQIPNEEMKKVFTEECDILVDKQGNIEKSKLYVYNRTIGCVYLKNYRCLIQDYKPLQCRIIPLHFDCYKHTIHILKRIYKRNWAMKCPLKILPFDFETFKRDLRFLKELNQCANDLNLKTFLPEIITYLENNEIEFKKGNLPKNNIIIYFNKNYSA